MNTLSFVRASLHASAVAPRHRVSLRFVRRGVAIAAALAASAPLAALAQNAPSPAAAPASAPAAKPTPATQTIVVTGNPLGSDDVATPTSVLGGDRLLLRRGSSLGDTLDGLPGVSASYFGPNANRPIIRGQDGDRIRILSNAGASLDASSLSNDHAVPIDPLVVERLEVLRGPAALLYGGSAVGGVVNAIDNRIPRAALFGTSGTAEVRLGGAASERGASTLLETGGNGFALHADAFARKTDDTRVPAFDRPLDDGSTERRRRISDSASDAKGGAFGGSAVWDHGYLGASVDTYRNDYGAVAEEGVVIHMKRDKFALAGEVRDIGGSTGGFLTKLRGQASHTDYQHQEVEGSREIGTTFTNKGNDYRLEATHTSLALGGGQLQGVFGLQGDTSTFAALGEEGFVPTTHTRQNAVFLLEEWKLGKTLQLSAGARLERVRVDSDGDADPAEPKFGSAQQRSYSPRNASVGAVVWLTPSWQLALNGAFTERAPASYELYANGIHAATGTFERGDLNQAMERSRNLDASLQWKQGDSHVKLGTFVSRFGNYIALVATGEPDVVDEGENLPVYAFRGVRARLYGVELEGQTRLLQSTSTLDLDGHVDWLRGDNLSAGEPLPRIAPVRLTAGLTWAQGSWSLRGEVQHADRQDRTPANDSATPGWTQVNLSASYKLQLGGSDATLFAKLHNAGNQLAYNATTIETVRQLAPLPGRSFMAGLRVAF